MKPAHLGREQEGRTGGAERRSLPPQERHPCHCTTAGTPVGVRDRLLRLSIGLEEGDDLIADLGQALSS
jgi:cystathionine beta-lyase/cystathionine gamma-synthase